MTPARPSGPPLAAAAITLLFLLAASPAAGRSLAAADPRATPAPRAPKSCYDTVLDDNMGAITNFSVGLSQTGNLMATSTGGKSRSLLVTFSSGVGGCGYQPPSVVKPDPEDQFQIGQGCDDYRNADIATASQGAAHTVAVSYHKVNLTVRPQLARRRLQGPSGYTTKAVLGTAYRWNPFNNSPVKGRWKLVNNLEATIQVDDLRAATGIWDPETNTIPFLNVSSLVELSRNGDTVLINWVADVCYATPINETTTDSRRRLLDIPTLDNGNFTVECYRAPGGGMSIFELDRTAVVYREVFYTGSLNFTYTNQSAFEPVPPFFLPIDDRGDYRFAALSADGRAAELYTSARNVTVFARGKDGVWAQRANFDIFGGSLGRSADVSTQTNSFWRPTLHGLHMSRDGSLVITVKNNFIPVRTLPAATSIEFYMWNPATADYLPVCLYNVDLCTLGFMDMLNSNPERTAYGETIYNRQRVALLTTLDLGVERGFITPRLVFDFDTRTMRSGKGCQDVNLVFQDSRVATNTTMLEDKIFMSSNGLNVLPTDLGEARLSMTTMPRRGWVPGSQPFKRV